VNSKTVAFRRDLRIRGLRSTIGAMVQKVKFSVNSGVSFYYYYYYWCYSSSAHKEDSLNPPLSFLTNHKILTKMGWGELTKAYDECIS
jgi:hypothetical protein